MASESSPSPSSLLSSFLNFTEAQSLASGTYIVPAATAYFPLKLAPVAPALAVGAASASPVTLVLVLVLVLGAPASVLFSSGFFGQPVSTSSINPKPITRSSFIRSLLRFARRAP